eukprot:1604541-Pleurochrysis_carterae.AAC.2
MSLCCSSNCDDTCGHARSQRLFDEIRLNMGIRLWPHCVGRPSLHNHTRTQLDGSSCAHAGRGAERLVTTCSDIECTSLTDLVRHVASRAFRKRASKDPRKNTILKTSQRQQDTGWEPKGYGAGPRVRILGKSSTHLSKHGFNAGALVLVERKPLRNIRRAVLSRASNSSILSFGRTCIKRRPFP